MQRFRDFPIDPSWLPNMVESGKIAYEEAKLELVRCGKGFVRRLADLECWHQSRQLMLVREMVLAAQASSRAYLQQFPRWPLVKVWLAELTKPLQIKKKCLVLQGQSRTGKTEWFGVSFRLELSSSRIAPICSILVWAASIVCNIFIVWDEACAS